MSDADQPTCSQCNSNYPYQDGSLWICPECGHEWSVHQASEGSANDETVIRDANGNPLQDGDTVTVVKDLKVKGASSPVKAGTKVKNIRLVPDSPDGHDISCKIDGFGAMGLKSIFVKKA
ncbi:zinc ribbon domain-containing protein YjdM [Pseudobacteriovorax antillogorgiicola]|uniref:Phosphonoacetate hydrolase n=1 Tax=Pseudobacteriovorax antillogorgiicola TaxID=1513793 RepID=A0A1Y6CLD0_9BACT|nr:zinc ribbon domain-containing protein YjdM [Pseudobacteriovorax antillogorgiicola]TCS47584.1 protein PhnA [Pseudobacteriovorax antillogorgiicola]SMF60302.1 phosphonoacetate hydrolase [Pseudobacteriovorax antillogorgiicola]